VFRFKPLSREEIFAVIENVAEEEKLVISEEVKQALFDVCNGDCRRLENILQSCAVLNPRGFLWASSNACRKYSMACPFAAPGASLISSSDSIGI